MFPHLFHIGSFAPPTYGFLAALGMISGLSVIFHLARFRGLDPDQMWNLGGIAAFSGIFGAKLLLILISWREYLADPGRIFSFATLQSGGVFSGGLVVAIACSWWYVRREKIPFLSAAMCLRRESPWATRSDALAAFRRDAAMAAKRMCRGQLRFTIHGRLNTRAHR